MSLFLNACCLRRDTGGPEVPEAVGSWGGLHFFNIFFSGGGGVSNAVTRSPPEYICIRCGTAKSASIIVQELCESRGGRPGLSVLTSLLVSVDVKNY